MRSSLSTLFVHHRARAFFALLAVIFMASCAPKTDEKPKKAPITSSDKKKKDDPAKMPTTDVNTTTPTTPPPQASPAPSNPAPNVTVQPAPDKTAPTSPMPGEPVKDNNAPGTPVAPNNGGATTLPPSSGGAVTIPPKGHDGTVSPVEPSPTGPVTVTPSNPVSPTEPLPPNTRVEPPAPMPLPTRNPRRGLPELPEGWNPVWWENKPYGRKLSRIALKIIRKDGPAFYRGATDIENFCPNYYNLSETQKENAWVGLISAVSYFESGHRLNDHMVEKDFENKDRVTGRQPASEGLLALSYQDSRSYPKFCGGISWAKDRHLATKSMSKTIFDPDVNLSCGIRVFHQQIARRQRIAVVSRAYWSVIQPGAKYGHLDEVQSAVRRLPICKGKPSKKSEAAKKNRLKPKETKKPEQDSGVLISI